MTADRERLAEALFEVDISNHQGLTGMSYDAAATALLPVVDRIANERAAAELRAMADDQDASTNHICDAPGELRDRAKALDPT